VNQHFGHATEFQIYELSAGKATFVGHRRVDLYCQGGYGEDEQLPSIVGAINDCHAVLVSKIGACPRDELRPPASSRWTLRTRIHRKRGAGLVWRLPAPGGTR
jgi:hypothetical protein